MSAAQQVVETCVCTVWDAKDVSVRFCDTHHAYFRGTKRLTSVTQVLKVWPRKPCDSCQWPIYSDHQAGCFVKRRVDEARERGIEVDRLLSQWLSGKLERVPANTREDSRDLFLRLIQWWNVKEMGTPKTQVILADDEIAGCCDLLFNDHRGIIDLKCTYEIDPTYPIQLAAYADLHAATFGTNVPEISVLHVTKRFLEPKVVKVDMVQAMDDWRAVKEFWRVYRRREKGK